MGNYEYATSIGSGTAPHILHGPVHSLDRDTYPVPDQRNALKTRRGEGAIILNPEDFSINVGLTTQAITVTSSATALPTIPLEYRRALVVHNNGSVDVFLGDSSVTTSTGLPLAAGEKIAFDVQGNTNVKIFAVCLTSADIRIMELA